MTDKVGITDRVVANVRRHKGNVSIDIGVIIQNFTEGFAPYPKMWKVDAQIREIIQNRLHHITVATGIHMIQNRQAVAFGKREDLPFATMVVLQRKTMNLRNTGNTQVVSIISQIEALDASKSARDIICQQP